MLAIVGDRRTESRRRSSVDWDTKASVRTTPRRMLPPDWLQRFRPFPADLVPIATHPLILAKGLDSEVLIQHLYRYLTFTVRLEQDAVNPVLRSIGSDSMFGFVDDGAKLDALRFYVDEAYHALFSQDAARQLIPYMGLNPTSYLASSPPCFSALEAKLRAAPEEDRPILSFLFATVSETLITGTLVEAPKSPEVEPAIRELLMDHARDEATHHAYFSRLFDQFWPRLSGSDRSRFSDVFGEFIGSFLDPDFRTLDRMLRALGLSGDEASRVLGDSYPSGRARGIVEAYSAATRALLHRNGVRCKPQVTTFDTTTPVIEEERL
jgi:P-aminobenzoate N-oxygenase AurF